MKTRKLIAWGKGLAIAVLVLGLIHLIATFTPLILEGLACLDEENLNAMIYMSLICGASLILAGWLLNVFETAGGTSVLNGSYFGPWWLFSPEWCFVGVLHVQQSFCLVGISAYCGCADCGIGIRQGQGLIYWSWALAPWRCCSSWVSRAK